MHGVQPARPRRRRISDRPQVVVPAQQRAPALLGVQLRRSRARHVQGSHAARADAASDHRRDPDRLVCDRLPSCVHVHPRRIQGRLQDLQSRDRRSARGRLHRQERFGQRLRSRTDRASGRRRVHLRRRDRAAQLARGPARRTAPQAAVPRHQRFVRRADGRQQRRNAGLSAATSCATAPSGSPKSVPSVRPASRSFRSAATSRIPATTKFRWAPRSVS